MRIDKIINEVNTRSKRIAPNIFNEPINCGFEAEIIWRHVIEIDNPSWMQRHFEESKKMEWEIIKHFLEEGSDFEIVKTIEETFMKWIEEEFEDRAKNKNEDKEDLEYEKEAYERDKLGTIYDEITDHTKKEYKGDYGKMIEDIMQNKIRKIRDISVYITDNWIMKESQIKKSESRQKDNEKDYDDIGTVDNDSWIFTGDNTIRPGFGVGMEIISPVYATLGDMLRDMKSLFTWLSKEKNVASNDTTGLHVTMSMGEEQQNELNKLKMSVLLSDTNILKDFDRNKNEFARSITELVSYELGQNDIQPNDLHDVKNIEDKINYQLSTGKNDSVYFKGSNLNNTDTELVEFRAPGGPNYLNIKNFNNILNAIKHYAVCLKAAYNDVDYDRSYKSLLGRLISRIYDNTKAHDGIGANIDEEKYPFIRVMKDVMFAKNYELSVNILSNAYDLLKHSPEDPEYHKAQKMFMKVFFQVCADISLKKLNTGIKHYKITKKALQDFNINDIKIENIYNSSDVNIASNKELSRKERFHIVLSGFNILMKQKISPDDYENETKYTINIFEGGYVIMPENLWNNILHLDKDSVYYKREFPSIFTFDDRDYGYINRQKNILLIPVDFMYLINLAHKWDNDIWDFEREVWEEKIVKKIHHYFEHIYKPWSISMLMEHLDEEFLISFHGDSYNTFINEASDILAVNVVPSPQPQILLSEKLIGPNGEPFDPVQRKFWLKQNSKINNNIKENVFYEKKFKRDQKLYQIVNELNTRSKKTEPGIFNEPIECGFEAEIVWEYIVGIQFDDWKDVKNTIAEYILEIIYRYAKDKIEDQNEYGQRDSISEEILDEVIIKEIDEFYNGSIVEFVKDRVHDFTGNVPSRDDLPKFITDEWILKNSLIKASRYEWDNNNNNYFVDENGVHEINSNIRRRNMWHFVEDESVHTAEGIGTGIEIISPVYPTISDMLKDMKSLFVWLVKEDASANETTGLHVTLNLKEKQQNEMNRLKLYTLAADKHVLDNFDREIDGYARNITIPLRNAIKKHRISVNDMRDFKNIEKSIIEQMQMLFDGYESVNVRSGRTREGNELVEFRSPGGDDYIEEENFHKIENAVKHYAICLKAAYNDVDYQNDYKRLLYRLVHKSINDDGEKIRSNGPHYKVNNKVHPFLYLMKNLMYPKSYNYYISDAHEMFSGTEINEYWQRDIFNSILAQISTDIVARNIKINKTHYKIIKRTMQEIGINDLDDHLPDAKFTHNLPISSNQDSGEILQRGIKEIFKFEQNTPERNDVSMKENLIAIEKEYKILLELNTRRKEMNAIFNEPIECGFEAEIVWTDIRKKNIIDLDRGWDIVKNSGLSDDILEHIYSYARDKIETKIEEMDEEIKEEEQAELESYLEDMKDEARNNYEGEGEYNEDDFNEDHYTKLFYKEHYEKPENEYKERYEEDDTDIMDELINEEIDGIHDGSTRNFIEEITNTDVYEDENFEIEKEEVVNRIINKWVMKHSHIQDAKNGWGNEDDGYDEDERDMWHFTEDSSIEEYDEGGVGLEIISPVYPNLNTMFEDMESLFLWLLHQKATTNDSTGLHVTLNLAEPQENDLNKIKLYTLASDNNILNDFGRERNHNTTGITDIMKNIIRRYAMPKDIFDIKNFNNIENILTKNIEHEKNRSVHVRPNRTANGNEMVEFRSAGGDHYLNKIKLEDVKNAVKHYAVCLKAAYNDVDYQRDYKNLLYRLIRKVHDYNEEEYETKGRDEYIVDGKTYPFIYLMQKTMYPNHYRYYARDAKNILYSDDELDYNIKYKFITILCQLCLDIYAKKIKTNSTHYKIIKRAMNDIGIEKIESKDLHSAMFRETRASSPDIRTEFDYHNVIGNVLTEIFRFEPELYQHENNFRITLSAYSDGQIAIKSELWDLLKRGGNDTKLLYKHFSFGNKYINKEKTILVIPNNYLQYAEFVKKWYAGDWSHANRRFWQNEVNKINELFASDYNLSASSILKFLNNEEFFDKDRHEELIDVMDKNNIEVKLETSSVVIPRYINIPLTFESAQAKINTIMREGIVYQKNFKRNQMPQINQEKLEASPFETKNGMVSIHKIKPVQTERVKKHIGRAKDLMTQKNYKRLVVDKDNYLVNGHHRYDAAKIANLEKLRVIKVNATIEDLMDYFKHTAKDEKVMQEIRKRAIYKILTETTGVGGIASVAMPLGGPIKRPNPSIYPIAVKKPKKKKKTKKQLKEMHTAKTKYDIDTYISGIESKIYSAIKQNGFIPMNKFNESEMLIIDNLMQRNVIEKARKNHLIGFKTYSVIL